MKPTSLDLHLGERVLVKVIEVVSAEFLIVGVYGSLVRVKNETSRSLKAGDCLSLVVVTINPIGFRMTEAEERSFDLRV